ncbi:MAG: hypothetical protein QNL21_00635 [Flavobacteriales bacterium]|jgi:hypothetical protein
MLEKIQLVRNAIDDIMNDVMEKAFHHLVNYPQDSDYLNKRIKDIRSDNEFFVHKLHSLKRSKDEISAKEELSMLTKALKNKSLVYLSELQKLKEKDSNKT